MRDLIGICWKALLSHQHGLWQLRYDGFLLHWRLVKKKNGEVLTRLKYLIRAHEIGKPLGFKSTK
ncbi:Hypothetical protein FKW44_019089 [Caligus rogercresseyi]|uniref:Uncharacterized protein n=1 Tax=Caligus rogercresseyi TaxID=217165 RepID=A0A7T8GVC5_CALRO|nr:Hypothetical protein FKW44_019089 [Caligus rogercresseyi]